VLYGIIVVKWVREATAESDRRLIRDAMAMGWYPIAYIVQIFPQSLVRFLQWRPPGMRPQHGWVILSSCLFATSGAVNVLLWLLTGRRFGFSSPRLDEEEHPQENDPYMKEPESPLVAGHSAHPSFPDDPPFVPQTHIPSPYEWMPPQEGGSIP